MLYLCKWGRRSYKILGWLSIGFACLFSLLRIGTPLLAPSAPQLSAWVAKQLQYPVNIQDLKLTWEGLGPAIALSQVEILTENENAPPLNVGKMKLRLNLFPLLFQQLQLNELVIEDAELTIERQADGRFIIKHFPTLEINPQDLSLGSQTPLFKRLAIKDSTLHFIQADGKKLSLLNVGFVIEGTTVLKIRGAADILGKTEGHIQVGADIPLIGKKEALAHLHWEKGDLTQLKDFFPKLPVKSMQGQSDISVWVKIKDQHTMELTTRFELDDFSLKNKQNKSLKFNFIRGQMNAQMNNGAWKITGKEWQFAPIDVASTKKINFIANSTLHERGRYWELNSHSIDLAQLGQWLEMFPPSSEIAQLVKTHRPQGQIDYLRVKWLVGKEQMLPDEIDIVFTDLKIKENQKLPGFSGLSGTLTFAEKQAKVVLESDKLTLNYPYLYSYPLEASNVAAVLEGTLSENKIVIKAHSFHASLFDSMLSGAGTWQLSKEKKLPDVEMMWHLDKMAVSDVLTLLPRQIMDEDLTTWLDSALLKGEALSTTCLLRGNLSDFPFDHAEGIFEVYTELDNAHLNYTKGWPSLTNLQANLLFRNRSLFIFAQKGDVASVDNHTTIGQLFDADAVIPNLAAEIPELIIDTKIASNLSKGSEVIQKSPLKESLGKTLSPLAFEGDMALSLGLEVPLSSKSDQEIKVRGLIEVKDAAVGIKEIEIPITELKGNVSFTQNSVKSDFLLGKLLGSATTFSLETSALEDAQLEVTASGNLDLQHLQKELHLEEIKEIKGETDYFAKLTISPDNVKQASLALTSSLQGIVVDAPYPFGKSTEELRPIECKVNFEPNDLMRLFVKYGDNINMASSLILKNKSWQPMGAHLHFGEKRLAKYREDQVLLVDGEIKTIDFQEWKTFLTNAKLFPVDTDQHKKSRENSVESDEQVLATSQDSQANQKTQNANNPFVLEPLVELNIENFILYGLPFLHEKIEAQWDVNTHQWNFHFAGNSLSGHAVLPQDDKQPIVVDLQKLNLSKSIDLPDFSTNELSNQHPVEVKIKELTLNDKVISDLQTRLEPSWKGYFFPNFRAKMKGTEINLVGNWDYLSSQKKVSAQGKITTKNVTDTLNALGLTGSFRQAKGTLEFSVQWNGTPAKIDFDSLTGQADLALNRGLIQGVNPGIGRVLSLLNLDNVFRRLNLDFSDVTKNGLTFDKLEGKFQFGKGKISSNKVILNSPTVKIEAFGQADFQNHALDGEMIVMPDLTGSLPVAAAIAAGNPAIGAAVWVVDKIFGNKIQQIHRLRYKVLGTWQSPLVQEVPIMTAAKER